jgi:CRISPR/Cas system-associated exonuclease Cas4 (RecB family)
VAKTTAAANVAIATLAKQTTDLSTTLAKQVADTATASEARQAAFAAEVTKRLSALELGFSERQGKQTLSDPQLEILKAETERNTAARLASQGSTMGISNMWTLLVAAGVLIIAALNYFRSHQNGKILRNGRK